MRSSCLRAHAWPRQPPARKYDQGRFRGSKHAADLAPVQLIEAVYAHSVILVPEKHERSHAASPLHRPRTVLTMRDNEIMSIKPASPLPPLESCAFTVPLSRRQPRASNCARMQP